MPDEESEAERRYKELMQRPQRVREVCKWIPIGNDEVIKICWLVPVPEDPEPDDGRPQPIRR